MTKYSKISAAAAMAAALAFGAVAQAQTSVNPPGSSSPRDASIMPEPGANAKPKRVEAVSPNGNQVTNSATQTPGTTKPTNNVDLSANAGNGTTKMSAEDRAAAKAAKKQARDDKRAAAKAAKNKSSTSAAEPTTQGQGNGKS
jgi:hypothetical protein